MKTKPKTKILPSPRLPKLSSVLPPPVGDGHTRTSPATVAGRRPLRPTHAAARGNHALHHTPLNAQS